MLGVPLASPAAMAGESSEFNFSQVCMSSINTDAYAMTEVYQVRGWFVLTQFRSLIPPSIEENVQLCLAKKFWKWAVS